MLETETSKDGIPPFVATAVAMILPLRVTLISIFTVCRGQPIKRWRKLLMGGANETKEHWVYDVTIENKTFKISLILTLST
jgi:hypothetical protein